jgi:hypothetical protein
MLDNKILLSGHQVFLEVSSFGMGQLYAALIVLLEARHPFGAASRG